MIELGEATANRSDRQRAYITCVAVMVPALAVVPIANRPLAPSHLILAIVVSIAIAMIIISAVLLWSQAHVTRSVPLAVLASAHVAIALVMIPYLLFYRGLWPSLVTAVSADGQSSAWLWLEWHLLFAATPAAFALARRWSDTSATGYRRIELRTIIISLAIVAFIVPPAIWIDGLPPLFLRGSFTSLTSIATAAVVVVGLCSIAALWKRPFRIDPFSASRI